MSNNWLDHTGKLHCPDPSKFCNQVETEGFCKRRCSGRGSCVDKECQCEVGWSSFDCSEKIHVFIC